MNFPKITMANQWMKICSAGFLMRIYQDFNSSIQQNFENVKRINSSAELAVIH